ncbi:hypothetical protein [Dyadobacter sp. NIV53]|uniref:hypothetical protein n=1 Tax=Dyadobacter sp. NIV53 TaxID=2861765 RepID=UPI001C886E0E|nr:hypothetical protein [Dyadobacter sp. NIV53]
MYTSLLFFHSIVRWFVLASLIFAIYRSYTGFKTNAVFSKTDDSVRHWTATIAHIQLTIGSVLYFISPLIKFFLANFKEQIRNIDLAFFGLAHILLMTISIVIITIGSALAKRKKSDKEKFQTIFIYFSIALFIIFLSIPWPFSPFANRALIRTF